MTIINFETNYYVKFGIFGVENSPNSLKQVRITLVYQKKDSVFYGFYI